MEDLFSTSLAVNNQKVSYRVVFDQEKYIFLPEGGASFPSFSFWREHDEWHNQELSDPQLKKQAIDALENYLLRQH